MAVHHLLLFQMILLLWSIKVSASSKLPRTQSCGNVVVCYPFGIDDGCYHDKWYKVTCNNSSSNSSQAAFFHSIDLEIYRDIYYSSYTAVVKFPAIDLHSSNKKSHIPLDHNLRDSPFSISKTYNRVIAFGCDKYALLNESDPTTIGSLSTCACAPTDQNRDCCYFICPIPPQSKFDSTDLNSTSISRHCKSSFLVDHQYLESINQTELHALKDRPYLPVRLEWGERKGRCAELFSSGTKYCNKDNYCLIDLDSGHYCLCDDITSDSYEGCTGDLICNTTNGHQCSEQCPPGYEPHDFEDRGNWCSPNRNLSEVLKKNPREKFVVIGCSVGLGMLMFLFIGVWWSHKFTKRRKEMRSKQKFFRRNGGLILQKHLSSNEGNIAKAKLFTSKELKKATDNYNVNRILGQGGQGTVFKGMLADGRIVAVKKSKKVDGSKLEEFINEVVILSQINHRNVVQLFGCCLETEVPLLVYEFISNGTLFQHLHDEKEEFPIITWELRLRIATEVAGVLSYMHFAASTPVYHQDVKSTNILLDDNYRAKVSDFGTSRSVMVDQTHFTTQVQGTFGYIDPEFFRSSQFTAKSDVYSFGVVLAELLTGQNQFVQPIVKKIKV